MDQSFLEIQNVCLGYQKAVIVSDLSFHVARGEIVTVIGPNGCGKSTVLKSIYGQAEVFSGEIYFDAKRITHLSAHEVTKLGVGYCPQRENFFPDMTVEENIEMGAYLRKDKQAIGKDIEEIFEFMPEIARRRKEKAKTLSGGEAQLLAIAIPLIAEPKLLVLDEPSASLSPRAARGIYGQIAEIRKKGTTILVVEQNVKVSLEISDRVIVLVGGKKVLEGPAKEILENVDLSKVFLGTCEPPAD